MVLYLKYISHKQHRITDFFKSNFNLCLLIIVVRPFSFNMIINMVKFKSIILLFVTYVLCPFSLFLCLIFKIIHFISFVGSLARGFFFIILVDTLKFIPHIFNLSHFYLQVICQFTFGIKSSQWDISISFSYPLWYCYHKIYTYMYYISFKYCQHLKLVNHFERLKS